MHACTLNTHTPGSTLKWHLSVYVRAWNRGLPRTVIGSHVCLICNLQDLSCMKVWCNNVEVFLKDIDPARRFVSYPECSTFISLHLLASEQVYIAFSVLLEPPRCLSCLKLLTTRERELLARRSSSQVQERASEGDSGTFLPGYTLRVSHLSWISDCRLTCFRSLLFGTKWLRICSSSTPGVTWIARFARPLRRAAMKSR